MTDEEISRRLALALGWPESSFYKWHSDSRLVIEDANGWRRFFDYRDPAVIWPIAERFNAFPTFLLGSWTACIGTDFATDIDADTAAKAAALAVIKAHEGAKE